MAATTTASTAITKTTSTLLQTRDGREVKFADSPLLCGSCHGPTYRDWEAGAHGRTSGYWDRSSGPMDRKICVNCHNPHSPQFPGPQARAGPAPAAPGREPSSPTGTEPLICRTPISNQNPAPADGMIRRSFLRTSAVLTAGLAALAASLKPLMEMNDFPTAERFMQKYYKEMTPEDMEKVLKRIENEVEQQYGIRPHVRDLQADGRRGVCLLPEPHPLHRLPQMRPCLRRGKQPVAQSGDSIHPRAEDAARFARHRKGRAQLRSGAGAGEGLLLHAGAMPAVQEPAVRQGLPGPRHLAGDRRHHGD